MKLEEHPFFKDLQPDLAERLSRGSQVKTLKEGHVVFEEGSASDSMFLVLEGRIEFFKHVPGKGLHSISFAAEGSFFGEIGIFTGAPRALRATAATKAKIAVIPRDNLVEFIRTTPGPIGQILQSVVNHLHRTTSHYVDDIVREEKLAVVGRMVNSIIHDFKNPFTLISLAAQIIHQMHDDERTRKLCGNIEAQIARMVEMANEVGEFSKGQQKLNLSRVALQELLQKFRNLNEPYFHRSDLTLEISCDPVTIEGEENKLLRVLQNLVTNAIDAVEEVHQAKVTVSVKERHDLAEITVSDNGRGIPEEIRDRLFEPFVTYGKRLGTGLGTAIAKSIVESHHGKISFVSTNKGTTFTIVLPKNQPTGAVPPLPAAQPTRASKPKPGAANK